MKKTQKVLCFDLPGGVLGALKERVDNNIVFMAEGHDPDLVLCRAGASGSIGPSPGPATPILTLGTKPEKIGPLLRRIRQMLEEPALFIADFRIGPYIFSAQEKFLSHDEGHEIALTDREVDILFYLARKKGSPVSRAELLKDVWRYQDGIDTHTLETHIYRLRQKIEKDSEKPELLLTQEEGYCLALVQQA